jgi:hypothetical protein
LNVGAAALKRSANLTSETGLLPARDDGSPGLGGDEIWAPDEPIAIDGDELQASAKAIADEFSADLSAKVS